jgi:thioredoxin 2
MKGPVWLVPIVLIVAVVAFLQSSRGGGKGGTPPAFEPLRSYNDAAAAADTSGKPVLVFGTASWCGPCQSFKRSALVNSDVEQKIMAGTEAVYLDVDNDGPTAQALKIRSLPTLVLVKGGFEVARLEGQASSGEVLRFLSSNGVK